MDFSKNVDAYVHVGVSSRRMSRPILRLTKSPECAEEYLDTDEISCVLILKSEAEWETCLRTIYCTNINKIVTRSNLKAFCEAYFGKVCRLKLLDNEERSTNIAFVEFAEVDGAIAALVVGSIAALGSGGIYLDGIPIRMCPSKSPIRTYCFGSPATQEGSLVDTREWRAETTTREWHSSATMVYNGGKGTALCLKPSNQTSTNEVHDDGAAKGQGQEQAKDEGGGNSTHVHVT